MSDRRTIGTDDDPHQYEVQHEGEPAPGRYVLVADGAVAFEPVDLPDEPSIFYPADHFSGEWVKLEEGQEAHCHWVRKGDGSFAAPPPLVPPPTPDPMRQLLALLRGNPGLLDELQKQATAVPQQEKRK